MAKKILIVGGGIAGLTLLACLEKRGIKATLIERAPKFETIGYVIGLFPNGLSILEYLGLEKKIIAKSEIIEQYAIKDMKGNDIWKCPMKEFGGDLPCIEPERALIQTVLLEKNNGADIRTNTTVKEMDGRGDSVHVTFSDGTSDVYNIVVGADGINSQVRAAVDPNRRQRYTGFSYWMIWMSGIPNISRRITNYMGDGKLLGTFPSKSSNGAMVFFGSAAKAHAYDHKAPLRELFKESAKSNSEIDEIIKNISVDEAQVFHHDDNELRGKVWHKGRVVLIGDAVHAFSPLLGMGGSMAMEDAYVLAEELSNTDDYKTAFRKYEKRRRPRIAKLVRHSILLHRLLVSPYLNGRLQPILFSLFGGPSYKKLVRELTSQKP